MESTLPPAAGVHVLVVGDVILDRYIHGRADRVSQEAPVPVVEIESSEDRLGGAANVALNVVSLGGRCTLVGAVGDDPTGNAARRLLEAHGIEADLVVAKGWRTTLKERVVSRQKQLLRMDFEADMPPLVADEVARRAGAHIGAADALVIEDYDKGAVAPEQVVALARERGIAAIADPKFKPFREYRGVQILKPNRLEFERAAGAWPEADELESVGCALARTSGVDAIALTRGDEGITVFEAAAERSFHVPAAGVDVYDSTGAGDTVAAALSVCTALGRSLAESVRIANVAGGVSCAKFGTAAVTVRELNDALASHRREANGDDARPRIPRRQLVHALDTARRRGERIVFTNGCFDILHAGHVGYLNEARRLGDRLIVAVNDDDSARRVKGDGRPVNRLERRMRVLQGLAAVDWVVPFSEDTPEALLAEIRPDVLVKGGDYALQEVVGADFVRGYGGDVRVLGLVEGCSTSGIVEHIKATP